MTNRLPTWLISFLLVVAAGGGLGWWVYQVTLAPTVTTTPPVSTTQSPLSSSTIDTLRQRTIYGDLPVKDQSPYSRTDPFVKP